MNPKERWEKEYAFNYNEIKSFLGKEVTKIEICCKSNHEKLKGIKYGVSERTLKRMFKEGNCTENTYKNLKKRFDDIFKRLNLSPNAYQKVLSKAEYRNFEIVEGIFCRLINEFEVYNDFSKDDNATAMKFITPLDYRYERIFELIKQFEDSFFLIKDFSELVAICRTLSQASKWLIVEGLRLEYLKYVDYETLKLRVPENDISVDKNTIKSIRHEIMRKKGKKAFRDKILVEDKKESNENDELQRIILQSEPHEIEYLAIYEELIFNYSAELRKTQDWFESSKSLLLSIFHQKKKSFFQEN